MSNDPDNDPSISSAAWAHYRDRLHDLDAALQRTIEAWPGDEPTRLLEIGELVDSELGFACAAAQGRKEPHEYYS